MRLLIIGAGHAGGTVAALLRSYGWDGRITLVGSEALAPYQRPPLSKAWLKGEADADSLLLRPADWYTDNDIDLHLGEPAEGLDLAAAQARLASGKTLTFDRLILATGARARPLKVPGTELGGVLSLRDAVDAERLKCALGPGKRLAVVGGGYVGLEAAASARFLGAKVTVIEREARLLPRVASDEVSSFYAEQHNRNGVTLELTAAVCGLDDDNGKVSAVQLEDGRRLACDVVLVGIGAVPNDDIARAAGLACDQGVLVDHLSRTSDPRVFAIGDVARRPLRNFGCIHRLESVPNALEQAKQVAGTLTGRPLPAPEVPWFWSDQYDLKLQIAGLLDGCDERVIRGDPHSRRFAVFHLKRGSVRAVEAINSPAEFMAGRQLIARAATVRAARLADLSITMKEITAG